MHRVFSITPFTLVAALLCGNAFAAAAPDLDAIVTHESTVVTHTGVTRTERFSERIIRRAGHVWTERVVPAFASRSGHAAGKDAEKVDHRHFDFEAAARHLTREADGKTRLEYVDRDKKWAVFVPASEYGPVGFSGNWEAEFYASRHACRGVAVAGARSVSAVRLRRFHGLRRDHSASSKNELKTARTRLSR